VTDAQFKELRMLLIGIFAVALFIAIVVARTAWKYQIIPWGIKQ
jgi:hypothetical protein